MMRVLLVCTLLTATSFAEEVLSSRPLVISPKRIETKTVLPPKVIAEEKNAPQSKLKNKKKKDTAVVQKPKTEEPFLINMNNVMLKITFSPGSIRLTEDAQKALRGLNLSPGKKIRISGFGDPPSTPPLGKGGNKRGGEKIANFRARVVASFLDEALGGINAELQWSANPYACCAADGAIIERAE
jgi:hypothetical protein